MTNGLAYLDVWVNLLKNFTSRPDSINLFRVDLLNSFVSWTISN
jgi:hypothetical protein